MQNTRISKIFLQKGEAQNVAIVLFGQDRQHQKTSTKCVTYDKFLVQLLCSHHFILQNQLQTT